MAGVMFNEGHAEGKRLIGSGGPEAGSERLKHAICLDQMLFSGKKLVLSLGVGHTTNRSKILKRLQSCIIFSSVQKAEKNPTACVLQGLLLYFEFDPPPYLFYVMITSRTL